MDSLTFDIETVPQLGPLTGIQAEELQKRLSSFLAKNPDMDKIEAKRLLMGTSPFFGEIVCIGLYKESTERSLALTGKETDILESFWDIIASFSGAFVSFNGQRFDIPFIIKRSMVHNIEVTNHAFLDVYPFKNYPHYDVWQVLSGTRGDPINLRLACDILGVPSPKEGGIEASEVAQAYDEGRIQEIADYCVRDVVSTFEVYKKTKKYYK